MSFSFNFADEENDDDVDVTSQTQGQTPHTVPASSATAAESPSAAPVKSYSLRSLLSHLPSQLSYTSATIHASSPREDRAIAIPRRALFDVRLQLLSEEAEDPSSKTPQIDPSVLLGPSDITQNVYEGGFKSWEGAHDLARHLLRCGPRRDIDEMSRVHSVIELGCGTALPSLVLLHHAISHNLSLQFGLADYNDAVLRLVTAPNVFLLWLSIAHPSLFSSTEGEIEVIPALTQECLTDLDARGLHFDFVAGGWSPALVTALPAREGMSVLVLAAETIYSPASISVFSETLVALLRACRSGKALVAAKRVYFGVGGSVDEFTRAVQGMGCVASEILNAGIEGVGDAGDGVGRCLVEVQTC